jgi:Fe-Mn family superoxide dismutase
MLGAVTGAPLIALDMYEHSYHMDYGTAAAKYVDAVIANLDWETIDARYKAALA